MNLKWDKHPERNYWWALNYPFGLDCWIKVYAGTDKFNAYAPGFRGPGNNFDTPEEAQEAIQKYLDKEIANCTRNFAEEHFEEHPHARREYVQWMAKVFKENLGTKL